MRRAKLGLVRRRGHAEFVQLSDAVTANTALTNIQGKPAGIQTRIDELERAIVEHRRPPTS